MDRQKILVFLTIQVAIQPDMDSILRRLIGEFFVFLHRTIEKVDVAISSFSSGNNRTSLVGSGKDLFVEDVAVVDEVDDVDGNERTYLRLLWAGFSCVSHSARLTLIGHIHI